MTPKKRRQKRKESRLQGRCVLHPTKKYEVVESEGKYYYLDGYEIQAWVLDQKVTFIADQSHAFDLIASRR
jgi:hypothetical protein